MNEIISRKVNKTDLDEIFLLLQQLTEIDYSSRGKEKCWEYYYDQMNKVNGKVYSLYDDKSILNYKEVNLGNSELHHRFNNNFKLKEIYTLSMCNYLLRADVSAISNVAILLSTRIKQVHTI